MSKMFSNLEVKKINHTTVKGSGTVLVAGTVQINFTIVQGKNGLFVSLPSREYTTKDGEKKYNREVLFPNKEVLEELQTLALEALTNGTVTPPKPAEDGVPF